MTPWPKSWRSASPGRVCPSCGTKTGRPIMRGMPGSDVARAIDSGEINVFLGGCCVSDDDPTHQCTKCGRTFGAPSDKRSGLPPHDEPGA